MKRKAGIIHRNDLIVRDVPDQSEAVAKANPTSGLGTGNAARPPSHVVSPYRMVPQIHFNDSIVTWVSDEVSTSPASPNRAMRVIDFDDPVFKLVCNGHVAAMGAKASAVLYKSGADQETARPSQ